MAGTMNIREAKPEDNQALLKLQLKCPQGTALILQFDRAPDFFARSQPYETRWVYVAEEDDRIVGSVECALRKVNVEGDSCKALYVFGIMVDPEHRRKGIASKLQAEADSIAETEAADIMYVFIVEENIPSIQMAEKMGFQLWKNTKENLIMAYKELPPNGTGNIRPLESGDVGSVVELLNEMYRDHDFYLPYTEETFIEHVERMPYYDMENILVYEEEGEVKACLGYWEYYKVMAPTVLQYNLRLKLQMVMVKLLGLVTSVPKIPGKGEQSKQFLLTPLAYKDKSQMRELVKHVNNIALKKGVHFFTIVAEEGSPQEELTEGYQTTEVTVLQFVKPLKHQEYELPSQSRLYVNVEDL
jgi:GNAT superfamily N-acetyltransferase